MSSPLESAEKAEAPARIIFGQIFLDSFYCVLEKGAGKVPFDPAIHSEDRRRTCVKLDLQPLERPDGSTPFVIAREIIADGQDNEWRGIVRPSYQTLGATAMNLNERWCQVELAETGRTFQSKAGEPVKATTLKFLSFYPDQAACEAARTAFYTRGPTEEPEQPALPTNGNSKQREVAAKFLPALWMQAGQDAAKFLAAIAANPLTKQHFGPDSPEVLTIVTPL
jgi:hypothetical protein